MDERGEDLKRSQCRAGDEAQSQDLSVSQPERAAVVTSATGTEDDKAHRVDSGDNCTSPETSSPTKGPTKGASLNSGEQPEGTYGAEKLPLDRPKDVGLLLYFCKIGNLPVVRLVKSLSLCAY